MLRDAIKEKSIKKKDSKEIKSNQKNEIKSN
jgi:hypothetical protein